MEATYWSLNCHDHRDLAEVNETVYKCTGNFWTDLTNFVLLLEARVHPCFKEPLNDPQDPTTDSGAYCAVSHSFDDFSLKILCTVLSVCPARKLKFNQCGLTGDQLQMLASLCSLEHLTWLQLDWNPGLPPEQYAGLLKEHTKLQVLSLRACALDNEAVAALCSNLKNNRTLRTLNLYDNRFNDLTPLAEMVDANRSVEHINLAHNKVTDEMLGAFVGAFGRVVVPDDKLEEFKKRDKETAKTRAHRAKSRVANEAEAPLDELIYDEETQQHIYLKNKVFRSLNLAMNDLSADLFLRQLLDQSLEEFEVLLTRNLLDPITLQKLQLDYQSKVVL